MILALALLLASPEKPFYTYVGRIGVDSFLLAWGTRDAIGRTSPSHGEATAFVDGRVLRTRQNWIEVTGLRADQTYEYELLLGGQEFRGKVRTYPDESERLSFLVLGDYGKGNDAQRRLAQAMAQKVEERADGPSPVRFVLTTGDNLYAQVNLPFLKTRTGSQDKHWEETFFEPYREILKSTPFYPTPGNHDGDESEDEGDLVAYLDNFFFPGAKAGARYYAFGFGRLAEFFALDSTKNAPRGGAFVYAPGGAQSLWLKARLEAAKAPWKIPYFHHPPFTAGPHHRPSYEALRHWTDLFQAEGVRVVFNGHEHNFQLSTEDGPTGGVCYVVTGAGGELRDGKPGKFNVQGMSFLRAWTAQVHFLLVEIEGPRMTIAPITFEGRPAIPGSGFEVNLVR